MEFFFDKFSVIKTEIKAREDKKKEDMIKLRQINLNSNSLTVNQIATLIEAGFSLEQILFVNKQFICKSVETAMNLMTKDSLTGVYNHSFFPNAYGICEVCNDSDKKAHLLYSPEEDIKSNSPDSKTKNNEFKLIEGDSMEASKLQNTSNNQIGLLNNQSIFNNMPNTEAHEADKKPKDIKYAPALDIYKYDDENICEICWDRKIDLSMKRECMHRFCVECVESYLENSIKNGIVSIYI